MYCCQYIFSMCVNRNTGYNPSGPIPMQPGARQVATSSWSVEGGRDSKHLRRNRGQWHPRLDGGYEHAGRARRAFYVEGRQRHRVAVRGIPVRRSDQHSFRDERYLDLPHAVRPDEMNCTLTDRDPFQPQRPRHPSQNRHRSSRLSPLQDAPKHFLRIL
jgi:hypothetical protein